MKAEANPGPTDADKQRCVLRFRYRRINPNVWRRVGRPVVDIVPPGGFTAPEITEPLPGHAEVRVCDMAAISFERDDLLGDYNNALGICDSALKARFPSSDIVDSISDY